MVKERAKLMDLVLAILGSLALIALHLHALILHHATVRVHALMVSALAIQDSRAMSARHMHALTLHHATVRELV